MKHLILFGILCLSQIFSFSIFGQANWTDLGYTYEQGSNHDYRIAVSLNDDRIVAFNDRMGGVWAKLSLDGGATWSNLIQDRLTNVIFGDNNKIWVATSDKSYSYRPGKFLLTTDNGQSWTEVAVLSKGNSSALEYIAESTVRKGNNGIIYISETNTVPFKFYKNFVMKYSEDNGDTWQEDTIPLEQERLTTYIKASDGAIYAGTSTSNLYKTTDNGKTWDTTNLNTNPVALSNLWEDLTTGDLYVQMGVGTLKSTDKGATWTGIPNQPVLFTTEFRVMPDGGFYIYRLNEAMYESSNGSDWNMIWEYNETGDEIRDMAVSNNYVYLAAKDSTLYRYERQSGGGSTGLESGFKDISSSISFYPNPVNNTLNVQTEGEVYVEIFDLTGRQVMCSLVYGTASFDVSDKAVGTYVIRFQTQMGIHSEKLVIQ